MKHTDEIRSLIGTRLARLFAEGNSKADCVRRVFPKMSEDSARKNAPAVFRRYQVVQHLLRLFPDTLGDKDCERLLNHLIDKAFQKGDDHLILDIIDRIAKIQGKYTEKFQVETRNLEEESARLHEAEAVLRRAGIDPARINLN